jgi:hypothetical protein
LTLASYIPTIPTGHTDTICNLFIKGGAATYAVEVTCAEHTYLFRAFSVRSHQTNDT